MRIVVVGSSGFLGNHLVTSLRADGHEVVRFVRREPTEPGELRWDPTAETPVLDRDALSGADVAINLCGAAIAGDRWTPEYKELLRESRIGATRVFAEAVAATGVPVLLNASAAGYYGDTGEREVYETDPPAADFLGTMCKEWEEATAPAVAAGARVVLLRTSNVLAADSEVLTKLSPIFKLGLGGKFGSGKQYMPWISLPDWIGAVKLLMTGTVAGPVNLVAPEAVTNARFAKAFGAALRRPVFLTLPGGVLKMIGGEAGAELLHGHKMRTKILESNGFRFQHETLDSALSWALPR
ncbi:TIGR01777 family oxidoreductase [Nocardia takedensis]|uniref:TIGR01777 family oxidoreductase n=1 Tax=Nocardia takedensis TaxID=259390 RepID=UPI00059518D3|nr:TIGR01777 family oxidoreductase [Nocardia takedensis]